MSDVCVKLCYITESFYLFSRESSRVVFVPFRLPRLGPEKIDDTDLLDQCRLAGDAVPIFIKLGKLVEEAVRADVYEKVSDIFKENGVEVTVRIK